MQCQNPTSTKLETHKVQNTQAGHIQNNTEEHRCPIFTIFISVSALELFDFFAEHKEEVLAIEYPYLFSTTN